MFHDIVVVSIDKHNMLDNVKRKKYTNKVWHFVKYSIFFFANLVTAAPEESLIPSAVLNKFISSNTIVRFLTEVTEHEGKEVAEFNKVTYTSGYQEAECEPEILLPLIVFLHNAMINRSDLRKEFAVQQAEMNNHRLIAFIF